MKVLNQSENLRGIVQDRLIHAAKRKSLSEAVFLEDLDCEGNTHYMPVVLTEIYPDGRCAVMFPYENEELRSLSDISFDSLLEVLQKLDPVADMDDPCDGVCIYTYPVSRFDRNVPDAEIMADYERDDETKEPVRKYTVDEFAALLNDEQFDEQSNWVRAIRLA